MCKAVLIACSAIDTLRRLHLGRVGIVIFKILTLILTIIGIDTNLNNNRIRVVSGRLGVGVAVVVAVICTLATYLAT